MHPEVPPLLITYYPSVMTGGRVVNVLLEVELVAVCVCCDSKCVNVVLFSEWESDWLSDL